MIQSSRGGKINRYSKSDREMYIQAAIKLKLPGNFRKNNTPRLVALVRRELKAEFMAFIAAMFVGMRSRLNYCNAGYNAETMFFVDGEPVSEPISPLHC